MLLGALESPPKTLKLREFEKLMRRAKITKLGKAMAAFPVAPRFGKMLALSHQVINLFRFIFS
jgi:ATP-dependent RNA helicase DHX37/DHR1